MFVMKQHLGYVINKVSDKRVLGRQNFISDSNGIGKAALVLLLSLTVILTSKCALKA